LEVETHSFLNVALDEGEWSTGLPGHFTRKEKPSTQFKHEAWWATKRAWTLQSCKNKTSCMCQELNHGTSLAGQVLKDAVI